ncbi:LrgB family protein [Brevibacillus humidisoli]|uniref:LrgB family protein n=1 Tax=Brevibacillus humidisoli TaxID=2895522 RepID=UPI001E5D011A|nr:LrgB family protein [Brevibacillus humidisoli]UFJ42227.1 LrgB family protein [Brevibacillus humidisoli]
MNNDLMTWLVILTLGAYVVGCVLFQKIGGIWTSPVLISPLLIIAVLWITHIDYATYQSATRSITFFLGPAQMALVIPLYKYRHLLQRYFRSIVAGVTLGSGAGIACAIWLAYLLGFAHTTIASLVPKSVTTPMAVSVSQLLGGLPELTALFAVLTGLTGILIGPALLQLAGVNSNMVKGLALGTAASLVGVSRAAQWGEKEGVMGSLGMTIAAALVAVVSPELYTFWF